MYTASSVLYRHMLYTDRPVLLPSSLENSVIMYLFNEYDIDLHKIRSCHKVSTYSINLYRLDIVVSCFMEFTGIEDHVFLEQIGL